MNTRRHFVRNLVVGGLSLPLFDGAILRQTRAAAGEGVAPHPIEGLFPGFRSLSVNEKVAWVEKVASAARSHPSGIMVCMPYVAHDGLRVVRTEDFEGMDQFTFNFGHRFKSITDFFTNENSITVSGSHLAAQSVRYQATGEAAALAAARTAYRSLRIVYEFGVAADNPGFMGKPFHFEYSVHTTGDQYLHALWGLWTFYPVASPSEQAEIRAMVMAMADYQIKVDYTIFNRSGGSWNQRLDPTDYNAIMAAIVAAAYKFSGETRYREAYEFVMKTGKWRTHRRIDYIIEQFKDGTYKPRPWDKLAGARVEEGEFAHWEQIQHSQFTAIAASIIHESLPELFSAQDLSDVVGLWWDDYTVGFDDDFGGYLYWFLVSAKDRSWRRVPRTERVPRDEWFGGHPMLSFASEWIYGDCLARFMWTAMVVARHCPPKRDQAVAFVSGVLARLEPKHLLWICDPDGRQIPPELRYFTEFLSSEVPENVVASYWEGRRLNLWS